MPYDTTGLVLRDRNERERYKSSAGLLIGKTKHIYFHSWQVWCFSSVGCILFVGWRGVKPFESTFRILKHLDIHPSIYSNGFPESSRVTKRLTENIGKPRHNSVFIKKPP